MGGSEAASFKNVKNARRSQVEGYVSWLYDIGNRDL
jgi:hypothetical protein